MSERIGNPELKAAIKRVHEYNKYIVLRQKTAVNRLNRGVKYVRKPDILQVCRQEKRMKKNLSKLGILCVAVTMVCTEAGYFAGRRGE